MEIQPAYVPFSDDVEEFQPNETQLVDEIVESMGRVNRFIFDKHRHAVRDAHAKIHGALKGDLEVYEDLPGYLRQGIFAVPKRYPVMVRLSSAPGDLQSDRIATPLGMAIKVLGVSGRKILPADQGHNQDFLLVNSPTIPFGNVLAYSRFQRMVEAATLPADLPEDGSNRADMASGGPASTSSNAAPSVPNPHILGESFHSMGAIRFGQYVAKISVVPLSESVRALTQSPLPNGDSAMRDIVSDFFAGNSAEFELRAQLLVNLGQMPIEDASVLWPEHISPHHPIGKISFPIQDTYSPQRRVYSDDVLSFNPWHCIEEHRPLGSIMRIRIKAYEASSSFRHSMNMQPRVEPNRIDDMPD